jgi:PadR family transcriptional regulator PadR
MPDPIAREFLLTFWKIHVLYHADEGGVYGQWMLEELRRHGYQLSPGTLYPLLARMEARGWLRRIESGVPKGRRIYRLTASGRQVLVRLRKALDELYREVGENARESPRRPSGRRRRPPAK